MANTARNTHTSGKGKKPRKSALTPEKLLAALRTVAEAKENTEQFDLFGALKKAGIRNPLLLLGSQHIRAKRTIDWIREQFFPDSNSSYTAYFGTELSSKKTIEPLLLSLSSPSLFSRQTMLVIYNADQVKSAAAKDLAEAITADNSETLIVLTAEDNSKKTNLPGLLSGSGTLVEIRELQGPVLKKWLAREAARNGAAGINDDAAALLCDYCGNDTTLLSREIQKLALLGAPNVPINRALVQQISFHTPEAHSFGLIQLLARKDARGSVAAAHALVEHGMHPMQISYFLNRCIRTMLAQKNNAAKESLHAELNNFWFVKQLSSMVRSFSMKELQQAIAVISKLDFQLKDSGFSNELALSIALQRIALRSTPERALPQRSPR